MKYILLTIISYFIGNISFAYILGKIFAKKDVREYGSGNAGATNAFRTFGKKVGALVFLGDVLKGVSAVLLGRYLGGQTGAYIAGAFVIIGHNWPVLLSFKGGKGVATTIGVMLFVNAKLTLICVIIGVVIIVITRTVSLGSISGMGLAPFVATSSHISVTTPKSWVMRIMEVPYFFIRSLMRLKTWAWIVTSKAVVGSSAISS
jgi:glycerol-3-phosphate acyltransferase PlsY